MIDPVLLRRFDTPDETRTFAKGRYDVIRLGGIALGRASYEPGWRWSEHVGAGLGQRYCEVEHLGFVLSGIATAALVDGRVFELRAGTIVLYPTGAAR